MFAQNGVVTMICHAVVFMLRSPCKRSFHFLDGQASSCPVFFSRLATRGAYDAARYLPMLF